MFFKSINHGLKYIVESSPNVLLLAMKASSEVTKNLYHVNCFDN